MANSLRYDDFNIVCESINREISAVDSQDQLELLSVERETRKVDLYARASMTAMGGFNRCMAGRLHAILNDALATETRVRTKRRLRGSAKAG